MKQTSMGLYVHIPFCVRKCQYCDFLSAPANPEVRERYVQALCKEIAQGIPDRSQSEHQKESVNTIFFGGGTPSLLTGEQMLRIMDTICETYHVNERAEISMEANPGTVTEESLKAYRNAGINRLSFGLQSAYNRELQILGRIHTWEDFCESYHMARNAGFTNINVDLMSALPGQSLETWLNTLDRVLAMKPEHISAYSLIIEEGTPFYQIYGEEGSLRSKQMECTYAALPDEDTERMMYEETEKKLNQHGLFRYEISNYARPGYECRHNIAYWKRYPYLGVGLGASSFVNEVRWNNLSDLKEYLSILETEAVEMSVGVMQEKDNLNSKGLREEVTSLSPEERMAEFLFLGLRMTEGILEADFYEQFGVTLDKIYGQVLKKQVSLGLICRQNGRIFLTPYGRDVSNQVFCDYI